jgi:hypothetical protein
MKAADAARPAPPARWTPPTLCPYNRARFEHDPEKACPGLDPGWVPVFGKDHAPAKRPAATARPGAQVAQLVEHVTENHGVGGSIPPLGTTNLLRPLIFAALFRKYPLAQKVEHERSPFPAIAWATDGLRDSQNQ